MSNPHQDYVNLQQQLQEINSKRAQNLLYLQSRGLMEKETLITTKQAAELAAMTQRGEDAGDNLEQYREWANRSFAEQNQRISRIIREHEDRDSGLERSIKAISSRLKSVGKDIAYAFDPKHLAETTEDQGRTLLALLTTSAVATNIDKVEGLAHKVSDFFKSGSLKESLGRIAGDEGKNGILSSLGKIIKAPFEYFVEWVKGELVLRAKAMNSIDIPTFEYKSADLGKLQPFGNIITSLTNFFRDFVTALGDKFKILIDPSSSITYLSNQRVSELAETTREKKRNVDAKTKEWNERGLLYTKDGERNYGRFIPSTFLTPLGGLDGTHGSTLAASREIYGIVKEANTGNRIDTASLVDVFNKLWTIAKRNGYILVEKCFLDLFENIKRTPINIHVLRRKFKLSSAIEDMLPFNLRYKKTIYLTDSEWGELNEDCKKDFKEICQVVVYKITLSDLEKIANGEFGISSFNPDNNEVLINSASGWLEDRRGGEGTEEEARLIERYTEEGMIDITPQIYSEERQNYETLKEEIKNKLRASEIMFPLSTESTITVQEASMVSSGKRFSLSPSNPGGVYPVERASSKVMNPATGKSGNVAYRNNNPGNIIWTGNNNLYPGEIPVSNAKDRGTNSQITKGFKTFETQQAGFEGIFYNLDQGSHYFKAGNNTIEGIIGTWCPNDPNYINNVSNAMGISKRTPLSIDDRDSMINIAKAIYKQEDSLGFNVLDLRVVEQAYDSYMGKYHGKGDSGGLLENPTINLKSFDMKIPFNVKQNEAVIETPVRKTADKIATSKKDNKNKEEINKLELSSELNSEKALIEAIQTCIIDEVGSRIDITNSLLK